MINSVTSIKKRQWYGRENRSGLGHTYSGPDGVHVPYPGTMVCFGSIAEREAWLKEGELTHDGRDTREAISAKIARPIIERNTF